ncbi:MAG: hypothetical protein ACUVWX_15250, partial [Kiritimatiellia bacterium]
MNRKGADGRPRRGKAGCLLLLVGSIFAAAVGWAGGTAGKAVLFCFARCLPYWVADDVLVARLSTGGAEGEEEVGVRLTISSKRFREDLKQNAWWGWLIPPGVIRNGLVVTGVWRPETTPGPDSMGLPLMLVVDDRVGDHPILTCRYGAAAFNALVRRHYEPRTRRKRRWFLGSYEQSHQIVFSALEIVSNDGQPLRPVRERRLQFVARGVVHFEFDDGWARANVKGSIGELRGNVRVYFDERKDGVALSYESDVEVLDVNVKKLLPWGDRKISRDLARSVENALNRPREKGRTSRIFLPRWVPLD